MAVVLGLAGLWYGNHEDMDFLNISKVKTEIHKKKTRNKSQKQKQKGRISRDF
jgi:hypothetical protein